ncbi:MAG: hypothetical protein LBC41_10500, partial [Clostridiales bacterium]|nr:hypothetical protein [Clostridiales bacterium]
MKASAKLMKKAMAFLLSFLMVFSLTPIKAYSDSNTYTIYYKDGGANSAADLWVWYNNGNVDVPITSESNVFAFSNHSGDWRVKTFTSDASIIKFILRKEGKWDTPQEPAATSISPFELTSTNNTAYIIPNDINKYLYEYNVYYDGSENATNLNAWD